MNYTLILNYNNKSKEALIEQLNAVSEQSVKPKLIWGCFMGCEDDELLQTYQEITKDWDNACFIDSNYTFNAIGRYQLALTAPTEAVIILDDDKIPRRQYAKYMLSIINNEDCLVGQYGWRLNKKPGGRIICGDEELSRPVDMIGEWFSPAEAYNTRYREKEGILTHVDYLCGGMAFRKSSLKYLFQEDIHTTATGEDIMFCLRCRKNDIPVYVYKPNVEANSNQVLCHRPHHDKNFDPAHDDMITLCRTNIIKHELKQTEEASEKKGARTKGPGLKNILNAKTDNDDRARLVGPPSQWHQKREFQIKFLKSRGLRPDNNLLDLGCGVLRGGIPLIEYLDEGKYYGIEKDPHRLSEGQKELKENNLTLKAPHLSTDYEQVDRIKFDYIWSYQVFIHLTDEILDKVLKKISCLLKDKGTCYATVNLGDPEKQGAWMEYPHVFRTLKFYEEAAAKYGLAIEPINDFSHPALNNQMLKIYKRPI